MMKLGILKIAQYQQQLVIEKKPSHIEQGQGMGQA
jgi:hypothetical protein